MTNPLFSCSVCLFAAVTHMPAYCICVRQSAGQQRDRARRHSGGEEETKGTVFVVGARCHVEWKQQPPHAAHRNFWSLTSVKCNLDWVE